MSDVVKARSASVISISVTDCRSVFPQSPLFMDSLLVLIPTILRADFAKYLSDFYWGGILPLFRERKSFNQKSARCIGKSVTIIFAT